MKTNNNNFTANIGKLIANSKIFDKFRETGELYPITLDIAPTNACNQNCNFCTVKNRDKSLSLSFERAIEVTNYYADHGLKSIELTGGGEPTLWKHFYKFMIYMGKRHPEIKIGLITNGLTLHEIDEFILKKFTWIRVSLNGMENGWFPDFTIPDGVDLSFNYVMEAGKPPINSIFPLIKKKYPKFLSFKIQEDVYAIEDVYFHPDPDERIFFSQKNEMQKHDKCFIGWIKPHLHADGNVYRCSCSAIEHRCFQKKHIINENSSCDWKTFKPEICGRCFFGDYNRLISIFVEKMRHGEFV